MIRKIFNIFLVLAMASTLYAVADMAFVSAYDAHPDEKDHVSAGQYYMRFWDPPAVDDARIRNTFSNYGASYLSQMDVVYFFAGKFARLVEPLVGRDYLGLRLFNVALLAGLMLLAWRTPARLRILFLPLFVSPQIWYIFSYFNGDALPLALGFACAALLARVLTEQTKPQRLRLILLGLLLGLLATSKQNYYVFLVFFACSWLAALVPASRKGQRVWMLRQAVLVFLIAGIVFGARFGSNLWATRTQYPGARAHVAEQMADEEHKPSSQADGTAYWGLAMRSRGITWTEMFTGEWKWHVFTYRSAFGKYGPMTIESPSWFYTAIGWLFAAFVLILFAGLLRRQACEPPCGSGEGGDDGRGGRSQAALFALFSALTVFQSFWHSWNSDFQSQGRYLFPILAMMACALIYSPTNPPKFRRMLWGGGILLWGVSMWSFVAVGLAQIAR